MINKMSVKLRLEIGLSIDKCKHTFSKKVFLWVRRKEQFEDQVKSWSCHIIWHTIEEWLHIYGWLGVCAL